MIFFSITRFIRLILLICSGLLIILPRGTVFLRLIVFLPGLIYLPYLLFLKYYYRKPFLIVIISLLGVPFIKFGQIMAARPDIVGRKYSLLLSLLQDNLSAIKFGKITSHLEKEWPDKKIAHLFKYINPKPIGVASIAQVHKAILYNGDIVAIKIIKPGLKKIIKRDLKTMFYFLPKISRLFNLKQNGMHTLLADMKNAIEVEIDLNYEAAAIEKFRDYFFKDMHRIIIPDVYWDYSTTNVLVTKWIEGIPFTNHAEIAILPYEIRQKLALNLMHFFMEQFFNLGTFHADPHNGNLLVTSDNRIGIVDFGLMGFLTYKERRYIIDIIYNFLKKDYDKVALLHAKAGYIGNNANIALFSLSCRIIGKKYIVDNPRKRSVGNIFQQIISDAARFGMEAKLNLILFQKTLFITEGILLFLDNNINLWQEAEPWLHSWILKEKKSWRSIMTEIKDMINNEIIF